MDFMPGCTIVSSRIKMRQYKEKMRNQKFSCFLAVLWEDKENEATLYYD